MNQVPPKHEENCLQVPPKHEDNGLQVPPKHEDNGLQVPPKHEDNGLQIYQWTKSHLNMRTMVYKSTSEPSPT